MHHSRILAGTIAGLAGLLGTTCALAAWPDDKPIRIVVPFAPGGTSDIVARLIGTHLSIKLKQTVVIDNKAGAGSMLGSQEVARSAPDGYTLLMGTTANAVNNFVYKKPLYDIKTELSPVTQVVAIPNFLAVSKKLDVSSIADLIKLAKEQPDKLSCANSGIGTSPFLSCELFKAMADVKITSVAYKGGAPAIQDVIGGTCDMFFQSEGLPYIKAGQVRPLGVTTSRRSSALPDVPAIGEVLPGFDITGWYALFGPAKLPPAVAERIAKEVAEIVKMPEVKETLAKIGAEPVASTPAEFKAYVDQQLDYYGKIIPKMHIVLD